MIKSKGFFSAGLLIFLLLQSVISFSQIHDYNFKTGLQINGILPATEFWESKGYKASYIARWLDRFELGMGFQIEIGAGYGSYAGLDLDRAYYRTEIIPVDGRLVVNMARSDAWNPYLYLGGGGIHYRITDFPSSVSPLEVKNEGWAGLLLGGLGIELALSERVILDLSGGANYTLTDDLNYYMSGKSENIFDYDNPYDAYFSGALGFIFSFGGGSRDSDHDGLMNREEKELNTDPDNPDTDGDGLTDGEEWLKYKTNPLNADTDNDGLKDGYEIKNSKTDPLKADTDGDGLKDGDEVDKYKTDPVNPDTDGDELKDGGEINAYKTDPLKLDTDGDDLSDGDELNKYKTEPLNPDTDGDGLKDGPEVTLYKTDPWKSDTDSDELLDSEEVNFYRTDPLKPDTDGGTVNDGREVMNKTNPLDPGDDIPKVEQELKAEINVPIVLDGIVFATASSEITPESKEILMQAFNTLDRHPEIGVNIQGHTDNVGKHDYNMKLSKRRADAVKTWLVNKGIDPSRITTAGFGPDKPLTSNDTPENRQKNRRIEFLRTK